MRAKRIDEIRRESDALRAIDAGKEHAFRTLNLIRREIPSIITDVTMGSALAEYAKRTYLEQHVSEYTEALRDAIDGSFDDYVKVDFIERATEEKVNLLYHRIVTDEIETNLVFKRDYWTYRSNGKSDEYIGDRQIYYYPTVDVVLILMWDKPNRQKEASLNAVFVRNK